MSQDQVTRIHQNIDRHLAERPDNPAVIDFDGRRLTYRDYAAAVSEAEAVLRGARVVAGDRVLIVAENSLAAIAFVFACSRLDAWAVPVNARMTAAEMTRIRQHATPRAVVFTVKASPDAETHAEADSADLLTGRFGTIALSTPFDSTPEPVEPGRGQVGVVLYTTGTTGAPKGVMLTQGNLLFAGKASAELRDMTPTDTVYGVLPMTHVFGLASMVVAASHGGACIRLNPRFGAEALYNALREDVTILPAVPQMHAHLMHYTKAQGYTKLEGSGLRYVSSGAAPLDPAWKRNAEAFYGIPLQNGYGMTETTAGVCATRNAIGSPDVSVGYALPGVEIKLDEDIGGRSDGVGEILTRGPHIMKGYFRNPEETEKVLLPDGFLRTGDLGRIDEDGMLHIVGRSKELIIRSGFNVYPQEVEKALNDHPAVVLAAVVGRTVEGGNEEVLAFVQVGDPAAVSEDELKAHIAESLSSYKRPSKIVITDRLPAAATGKILKNRLIETFRDQL